MLRNHYRAGYKFSGHATVLLLIVLLTASTDNAWSRDAWSDAAHLCHAPDGVAFASKGPINQRQYPDNCDDGDSTLFNGLLCASGDTRGCEAVKRSLSLTGGTEEGRFWRSTRRAQTNNYHFESGQPYDGDAGNDKSFSPDQELGVLLYAVTTHDKSSVELWFNWMDHHRPCVSNQLGSSGCGYRGLPRYCEHENCTMRPIDRDMDDAVFGALGGTSPAGIRHYRQIATTLSLPLTSLIPFLNIPIQTYLGMSVGDKVYYEASRNPPNFPMHLSAIRAWLLIKINHVDQQRAHQTISMIAGKQPENALYQYLNEDATTKVAALVKQYCPAPSQSRGGDLIHWTWESDSSQWTIPAKIDNGKPSSMLWDCIFMRNLLGESGKKLGMDYGGTQSTISSLLLQ